MRIVIDARKLGDYGIGTYIEGLGAACARLAPGHDFAFLGAPTLDELGPGVDGAVDPGARRRAEARQRCAASRVTGANVHWYTNRSRNYSLGELFSVGRQARRLGADIFHAPHYVYPVGLRCPGVVSIHDCIHLRFPGQLPHRLARLYARGMLWRAVRAAAAVVTVSKATRDDLVELVGADPDRIVVIPNAVDRFFLLPPEPAELEAVRDRYDLVRPFLLYVGNVKPHKNLTRLLQAFGRVAADHPDIDLVLVGDDVDGHPSLQRMRRDLDLGPRIRFPGFLPRAHLRALYTLATAFVFPSLYEGFGLPPLEAMACGTPVVTADRSSMPEVVGDAGVLVNPFKVDSIAAGIERLVADAGLRTELGARGREAAGRYTWSDAARQLLEVYESVAGR